jgi:hypothetical protein
MTGGLDDWTTVCAKNLVERTFVSLPGLLAVYLRVLSEPPFPLFVCNILSSRLELNEAKRISRLGD